MLKNPIAIKICIIILLAIGLQIPLSMISSIINDRSYYQDEARKTIADSWTGKQKIIGPLLLIPYTRQYQTEKWNEKTKQYIKKQHQAYETAYILPENLQIDSEAVTENRYKGIYDVPVYTSAITFSGSFANDRILALTQRQDISAIGNTQLALIVGDIRGISTHPTLQWNKQSVNFLPSSGFSHNENGIHANLGKLEGTTQTTYTFSFSIKLRGMETIQFTPSGKQVQLKLSSSWQHPNFIGRYLPQERTINAEGFKATWVLSSFSTNIEKQLKDCESGNCNQFLANDFGVTFIDPVNVYLQAERSLKYDILFIGLTFVGFFLFEVLLKLKIHPVQYTLVGLALTMFYLLLISFSEHISFFLAYMIATISSVGLLGFYVSFVLKSASRGTIFSAVTTTLYAVLYVIICSEDHALLMGTILIFMVLGFVMFATRHVDWYTIMELEQPQDLSNRDKN